MHIMESRYDALKETMAGYQQTGIPFVGHDGISFTYSGFGDDQAIYYLIPKIAKFFHIPLDQAIDVFFGGMILLALLSGVTGFFLFFKRTASRIIVLLGLGFLSFAAFKVGDVYIAASAAVVASVPLFVYFAGKLPAHKGFFVFLFLAGLGLGISQFVRAHSATAVLLFMVVVLLFTKTELRKKLVLFSFLGIGLSISAIFFHVQLNNRDSYLQQHESGPPPERRHIFWHSAYIGLGFIDNPYVEEYRDEVAFEKVKSINPAIQISSKEYEEVLKNEVIHFISSHPTFFVMNIGAKSGVMILYLIMFANIGLVLSFFYKKPWQIELAFMIAMLFNSLFGLIVVPDPKYVLGFISFAAIYGIFSINFALESGTPIMRIFRPLRSSCAE